MAYKYHEVDQGYLQNTNRLRWIEENDQTNTGLLSTDLENQQRDNYAYDEIGNLIQDQAEDIDHIEWNVSGKVHAVIRKAGSQSPNLYFSYYAMGNRIAKKAIDKDGKVDATFYIVDATGNTMAVYTKDNIAPLRLEEQHIYGSSRLGLFRPSEASIVENRVITGKHMVGDRSYEFKDHLGNVHLVLSDKKDFGNNFENVLSFQEYYPFGWELQGENMTFSGDGSYRYGFNGMEKDDEVKGSSGSSYDFGARMYDPRVGRWNSVDPMSRYYSGISPYTAIENSPLVTVDNDGKKNTIYIYISPTYKFKGELKKLTNEEVQAIYKTVNTLMESTGLNKLFDVAYTSHLILNADLDKTDARIWVADGNEVLDYYKGIKTPRWGVAPHQYSILNQHGITPPLVDSHFPSQVNSSYIADEYLKDDGSGSLNMTTMIGFTIVHEIIHQLSDKSNFKRDKSEVDDEDHSVNRSIMSPGQMSTDGVSDISPNYLMTHHNKLNTKRFNHLLSYYKDVPDQEAVTKHNERPKVKGVINNVISITKLFKRKQNLNYSKTDGDGKSK